MVNLEALANDLRAAGYAPEASGNGIAFEVSDGFWYVIDPDEPEHHRVSIDGYLTPKTWDLLALIARHLGAGQPVAGTGETLYLVCGDCGGSGEKAIVLQTHREVVGPCEPCIGVGFVPVAPPEPLSAGERRPLVRAIMRETWDVGDDERDEDLGSVMPRRANAALDAVLAALPSRHAVRVEGA